MRNQPVHASSPTQAFKQTVIYFAAISFDGIHGFSVISVLANNDRKLVRTGCRLELKQWVQWSWDRWPIACKHENRNGGRSLYKCKSTVNDSFYTKFTKSQHTRVDTDPRKASLHQAIRQSNLNSSSTLQPQCAYEQAAPTCGVSQYF